MTIRKFIKKLFVTIIMIGIVLAAVLKVGYILICKVIVMIIFAVLAIQYWVGEDIRKAEEEKRGNLVIHAWIYRADCADNACGQYPGTGAAGSVPVPYERAYGTAGEGAFKRGDCG